MRIKGGYEEHKTTIQSFCRSRRKFREMRALCLGSLSIDLMSGTRRWIIIPPLLYFFSIFPICLTLLPLISFLFSHPELQDNTSILCFFSTSLFFSAPLFINVLFFGLAIFFGVHRQLECAKGKKYK